MVTLFLTMMLHWLTFLYIKDTVTAGPYGDQPCAQRPYGDQNGHVLIHSSITAVHCDSIPLLPTSPLPPCAQATAKLVFAASVSSALPKMSHSHPACPFVFCALHYVATGQRLP